MRCVRTALQYLGQENESTKKRQPTTDFSASFEAIDRGLRPGSRHGYDQSLTRTGFAETASKVHATVAAVTPGLLSPLCRGQDGDDCDIKTHDKAISTVNCTGRSLKESAQCLQPDFGSPKNAGIVAIYVGEAPPLQSGASCPRRSRRRRRFALTLNCHRVEPKLKATYNV
jgi:hypothetical protein